MIKRQQGFTLLEIIVVITIIAILAAMLLTILVYLRLRIKVANLSLLDDVMAKV